MPVISVQKEKSPGEKRVALVPGDVASLVKIGLSVFVEKGAGVLSGFQDEDYLKSGAEIIPDTETAISKSDVLLAVKTGYYVADEHFFELEKLKLGQIVIGMMDPYQPARAFEIFREKRVTSFALELIPRTTRAQSMDVLSSQANIAGYKGVLLAAGLLPRIFPMMMTAAGTLAPAKVFVLGAGVAGLQAIATAKRLGAVVSAFDVRPIVKEQVQSLGARFVEFDVGDASGQGGYAKELTPEQQARQKEMMESYIKEMNVVISTAAIPGRPSPKLITEKMVRNMSPGSVIIDLAAERGGNCELSEPGETVIKHGVTISAPLNIAGTVAGHASQMYSRNVANFLKILLNKENKISINMEDDIVSSTLVTHAGNFVSEKLASILSVPKKEA